MFAINHSNARRKQEASTDAERRGFLRELEIRTIENIYLLTVLHKNNRFENSRESFRASRSFALILLANE